MSKCRIDIKGNCDDEKICHCENCYNNIEESIFEGAKFGDKFLTRDGRIAIYWHKDPYKYEQDKTCYNLILESEDAELICTSDGLNLGSKDNWKEDIVSRYQETIDEEKLEELSYDYIYDKSNDWAYDSDNNWKDVQNAYKDGYHERAKENYGK